MCRYNKEVNINTQVIQPISKVMDVLSSDRQATAQQRAGRAGRVTQGYCFRLYTEEEFVKLEKREKPEVQRLLLCDTVLLTRQLGIQNVVNEMGSDTQLDTFDLPSEISSSRYYISCQILMLLDALGSYVFHLSCPDSSNQTITPRGLLISQIPVDSQLGRFDLSI